MLGGPASAGASVQTPTKLAGNSWRFPISGLSGGTLNVTLAPDPGGIEDSVGNDLATSSWSYSVGDSTPPTIAARDPAPNAAISSSIVNVDVTFSEPVTAVDVSDFVLSDPAATGASVQSATNVGGNKWRFAVAGLVSGSLRITLAPDANDIEDASGNDLATSVWTYTVNIDNTPPTVTGRSPAPGSTIAAASVNIDVTFSESVVGVDATDFVLSDPAAASAGVQSATNVGGNTWRFAVAGLVNGALRVSLAPDANDIEDNAGNDLSTGTWTYTVAISGSPQPPVLDLIGNQTINNGNQDKLIHLYATDPNSDPLTFSATGQSIEYYWDQFLGLGANDYYNFSNHGEWWFPGSGNWYYILPNGNFYRSANSSNAIPNTDPLLEQLSPAVHQNPSLLHSAAVNNPPATLNVTGNILSINPTNTYVGRFVVTASVSDGQGGSDSEQFFVSVLNTASDNTPPSVTSQTPTPNSTIATNSFNLDVIFSETVVRVDATDLALSGPASAGGTVQNPIKTAASTWRFPISGLSGGALTVTLAPDAGDIEDSVGNDLASTAWSYNIGIGDTTPPTIIDRTPVQNSTLTTSSVNIDVTFSEAVVGVDASDLALSGAAAAGASVQSATIISGNTWRFAVVGLPNGLLTVTLAPDPNDIEDSAGNDLASLSWSYSVNKPPMAIRLPL